MNELQSQNIEANIRLIHSRTLDAFQAYYEAFRMGRTSECVRVGEQIDELAAQAEQIARSTAWESPQGIRTALYEVRDMLRIRDRRVPTKLLGIINTLAPPTAHPITGQTLPSNPLRPLGAPRLMRYLGRIAALAEGIANHRIPSLLQRDAMNQISEIFADDKTGVRVWLEAMQKAGLVTLPQDETGDVPTIDQLRSKHGEQGRLLREAEQLVGAPDPHDRELREAMRENQDIGNIPSIDPGNKG